MLNANGKLWQPLVLAELSACIEKERVFKSCFEHTLGPWVLCQWQNRPVNARCRLVAGHKTTTLLLTWALYYIARNPRIEKSLGRATCPAGDLMLSGRSKHLLVLRQIQSVVNMPWYNITYYNKIGSLWKWGCYLLLPAYQEAKWKIHFAQKFYNFASAFFSFQPKPSIALNSLHLWKFWQLETAGELSLRWFGNHFGGDSGPRKPGNSLRNYARWVLVQYHLRLRGLICAFLSWLLWRQIWVSCMVQHKVPKIGSSNEKSSWRAVCRNMFWSTAVSSQISWSSEAPRTIATWEWLEMGSPKSRVDGC